MNKKRMLCLLEQTKNQEREVLSKIEPMEGCKFYAPIKITSFEINRDWHVLVQLLISEICRNHLEVISQLARR